MRARALASVALAAAGLGGVTPAADAAAGTATPATIRPTVARTAAVNAATPLPRGSVDVIAQVPAPGDPALPLVSDGDIFEGTYTSAAGSSAHSHVFKFSSSGALLDNWTLSDQPEQPYGVQVANTDAAGDPVLLDDTSGRVLLMNPQTGVTSLYATIPDIPRCSDAGASSECSDALTEETPEPDYAAWGPDGSLYITDYQQAVIWRVPPHGGTPSIWLGGSQLDGELFGTAGIWMEPDHHTLLIDQASNLGGSSSDETTGRLYSVQLEPDGEPGPLHLLWTSNPGALPDGFVVAQSGDIYMAQIGPSGNDIVELSPTGQEITSFGTAASGLNGSPVPFDEPSGVAYFGDNLVIANQSYLLGDTSHMALLALGTGEPGQSVYVPSDAGPAVTEPTGATPQKPTVIKRKTVTKRKPVKRKKRRHARPRATPGATA